MHHRSACVRVPSSHHFESTRELTFLASAALANFSSLVFSLTLLFFNKVSGTATCSAVAEVGAIFYWWLTLKEKSRRSRWRGDIDVLNEERE